MTTLLRSLRDNNLIDNHPDGLGKHIQVIPAVVVHENELLDFFMCHEIPLWFTNLTTNERFFVCIGSDLVHNIPPKPTLDEVQAKVNELSFYLKQVYTYMNLNENNIRLDLPGFR